MAAEGKTTAATTRKKVVAALPPTQGDQNSGIVAGDTTGAANSAASAGATGATDSTALALAGTPGDGSAGDATGASDFATTAGAAGSTDTTTLPGAAGDDGSAGDLQDKGNSADVDDAAVLGLSALSVITVLEFPRLVEIVNDTPIPYVVARHHVAPHSTMPVPVNDEDELARMRFECASILSISDHYKDSEPPMLRVAEVE
jgi:hypothetical protein